MGGYNLRILGVQRDSCYVCDLAVEVKFKFFAAATVLFFASGAARTAKFPRHPSSAYEFISTPRDSTHLPQSTIVGPLQHRHGLYLEFAIGHRPKPCPTASGPRLRLAILRRPRSQASSRAGAVEPSEDQGKIKDGWKG